MSLWQAYLDAHQDEAREDLQAFLRIPQHLGPATARR